MTTEPIGPSVALGLIDHVEDWLMAQALSETEVVDLVEGCCNRLLAAGVPLWRALVSFRTLHPLYESVWLTWRRDQGMGVLESQHGRVGPSKSFRESPFFHMIKTDIPFLRRRLVGDGALLDFPVLTEFRDQGATDYLASLVPFGEEAYSEEVANGITASWATDRPTGFTDLDIQTLLGIEKQLAVVCKVMINDQVARNVVTTYLGPSAGRQVLRGQIRRGDGETIHAVLWYSDLRGSTRMADTLPTKEFLSVVNTYFECTAGAVLDHGGEVLLLIGDAVLAIFPIRGGRAKEKKACAAALAAVHDAEARLAKVNEARSGDGEAPLSFGLGLHLGDLMYGNIGVPERLQFTVMGPAVNEVARLEGLTKPLDRRVLVSGEFAKHLSLACESLGNHELRGLGEPREVFALPLP